MFGYIGPAVEAAKQFPDRKIIAQIRDERGGVLCESNAAIDIGVDLLMVDTGRIEQLFQALDLLSKKGIEDRFQVSFSGGITLGSFSKIADSDSDAVCIAG
jgi:nicotinate-nucleotide pyrophosphorylase